MIKGKEYYVLNLNLGLKGYKGLLKVRAINDGEFEVLEVVYSSGDESYTDENYYGILGDDIIKVANNRNLEKLKDMLMMEEL